MRRRESERLRKQEALKGRRENSLRRVGKKGGTQREKERKVSDCACVCWGEGLDWKKLQVRS